MQQQRCQYSCSESKHDALSLYGGSDDQKEDGKCKRAEDHPAQQSTGRSRTREVVRKAA